MEEPSRKRGAGNQRTRDDASSSEGEENPTGTFKKADSEVLAQRVIRKAKRPAKPMRADESGLAKPVFNFASSSTSATESTAASTATAAAGDDKKEAGTPAGEKRNIAEDTSDHQQKKTKTDADGDGDNKKPTNPFAALAASKPMFQFGAASSGGGDPPKFSFASVASNATPGFTFTAKAEANTSSSDAAAKKPIVELKGDPQPTGEEDERMVTQARCKLFVFEKSDGEERWRESGIGNVRLNVKRADDKCSRVIFRTEKTGVLKVNMRLFKAMGLSILQEKNIQLGGFDESGELKSFLLRFARGDQASEMLGHLKTFRDKCTDGGGDSSAQPSSGVDGDEKKAVSGEAAKAEGESAVGKEKDGEKTKDGGGNKDDASKEKASTAAAADEKV